MAAFDQAVPEHKPELKQTRFHEADDGKLEMWQWNPQSRQWTMKRRQTREEWDALADEWVVKDDDEAGAREALERAGEP